MAPDNSIAEFKENVCSAHAQTCDESQVQVYPEQHERGKRPHGATSRPMVMPEQAHESSKHPTPQPHPRAIMGTASTASTATVAWPRRRRIATVPTHAAAPNHERRE